MSRCSNTEIGLLREIQTMSTNASDEVDCIDIEPRTERALTECMTVVSTDGTPVTDADEETVSVISSSGSTYTVDAGDEFCDCPDHQHNHRRCKHIRRARFALGIDELSAAMLREFDIAENFAAHAPGPIVLASDGGVVNGDSKTRDESHDEDDPEDDDATLAAIIEDRGPRRGSCCDVCGCRIKGGFCGDEVVCHDCARARRRDDRHTILSRIRTYGGGSEVDEHTTLSDLFSK
jgi:hypothetical protein